MGYKLAAPAAVSEALAAECPVLGPNADCQDNRIEKRKDEPNLPQSENQRQHGNFADDDEIIGVIDEAVGAAADKGGVGQDDDPRRPARAEAREDPNSSKLQQHEQGEPEAVDR